MTAAPTTTCEMTWDPWDLQELVWAATDCNDCGRLNWTPLESVPHCAHSEACTEVRMMLATAAGTDAEAELLHEVQLAEQEGRPIRLPEVHHIERLVWEASTGCGDAVAALEALVAGTDDDAIEHLHAIIDEAPRKA